MAQPVAAQVVANNRELQVNPLAIGGGVLLYPGGQYMRNVRPLFQPGENLRDRGPVTLRMPSRRARLVVARSTPRAAPVEAAVPAEPRMAAAPKPAPAPKAKPEPKVVAAAKPAPQVQQPSLAPSQGAAGLDIGNLTQTRPVQTARNSPPPSTVTQPPAAASGASGAGLTKRSVILFAPDSSDPAEAALGAIKFLAGDLNAAMNTPSARIQIQAFGGRRGDKGSDARRLSLKRALAIRQVLIDDGVASERIDVRAMGGADDSGPADRVDVYIKA